MNGVKERDFKPKRADIGFVFQDPGSSFNPLMTIAENVAEPLLVHHKYGSVADAKNYVGDLLEMVQLPRAYMNRFPHELSGQGVGAVQATAGGNRLRVPVHHP